MIITFVDDLGPYDEGMCIRLDTDKGITFEYMAECGYYHGEYFIDMATLRRYVGGKDEAKL